MSVSSAGSDWAATAGASITNRRILEILVMIDLLTALVGRCRQMRQCFGGQPTRAGGSQHRASRLAPFNSSLGAGSVKYLQNLAHGRRVLRFVAGTGHHIIRALLPESRPGSSDAEMPSQATATIGLLRDDQISALLVTAVEYS